jgi:signal transduction histidine kinase
MRQWIRRALWSVIIAGVFAEAVALSVHFFATRQLMSSTRLAIASSRLEARLARMGQVAELCATSRCSWTSIEMELAAVRQLELGQWREALGPLEQAITARDLDAFRAAHSGLSRSVSNDHTTSVQNGEHALWRIHAADLFAMWSFALLCLTLAGFAWTWRKRQNTLAIAGVEENHPTLEKFAARIAHDVLSPLQSVSTALEIATNTQDPEKLRRCERSGKAGLRRVQVLMDGLVEFARAEMPPDPTHVASVDAVLNEVLEELSESARNEQVELRVEEVLPAAVAMEPRVLKTVFRNLVRNAIQYMPDQDSRERWVSVRTRLEDSRVRIEVEDSGNGIPASELKRVFQPYVRPKGAKKTGLGLGLATVRKVVEAHSGSVNVSVGEGQGTCFTVELPRIVDGVSSERPPTYLS